MFAQAIPHKWFDINEPAPTSAVADVPSLMQDLGYSIDNASAPGTYVGLFARKRLTGCSICFRPAFVGSELVLRVFIFVAYNPTGVLSAEDPLELACWPLQWVEGCTMLGFDVDVCEPFLSSDYPLLSSVNHALMPGESASRIANITMMSPKACVGFRDGETVQLMTGLEPIPLLAIGYELPWTSDMPLHLGPTMSAVLLISDLMVMNSFLQKEIGGVLAFE
jgi:hypothetical protein